MKKYLLYFIFLFSYFYAWKPYRAPNNHSLLANLRLFVNNYLLPKRLDKIGGHVFREPMGILEIR